MDNNIYWETFFKSGKISDYINYKRSCENAITENYANQDGRTDNWTEKNR